MPGKVLSELRINDELAIPLDEISISAIRAQGAGGQNVNKVSNAIHLRFDVNASRALSEDIKLRLLNLADRRITDSGVIIIKSQSTRSREKNREDALKRLAALIAKGMTIPTRRKATKPSKNVRKKRLDQKTRRGRLKQMRSRIDD
jgi:ribosome-associated protein